MKTAYEILLMLDPELAEERQNEVVTRARELVERDGGTWRSHDAWGRRRLAYEIGHKGEGVYHLVVFDAEPAALNEVSRVLKITDGVIRHLAVRHIEGSRTSAPREDAPPPPSRDDVPSRQYAGANVRSQDARDRDSLEDRDALEESATLEDAGAPEDGALDDVALDKSVPEPEVVALQELEPQAAEPQEQEE